MRETLEKNELQSASESHLPETTPATDEAILAYLRYSRKIAEIAVLAEQDDRILKACQTLDITVTDAEWQAAGDAFRLEHQLLGAAKTLEWLSQQRLTAEDWSQGIKVELLTKKLQEHLFGEAIDHHYLHDREKYKRVALSQILVTDLSEALKVAQLTREQSASFCALALEYSKGKQSKENGGFMGIRFFSELLPEIAEAISAAKEGEIIGPLKSRLGYHILKVEKWLPLELDKPLRTRILELLLQTWLQQPNEINRSLTET